MGFLRKDLDCEPIACQALWLIKLPKFKSCWSSTGQTNQVPSLGPDLCLQIPEQTWLQGCIMAFLDCITEFLGSTHFCLYGPLPPLKKKLLKLYFMTALVQEGILSLTGLCYNLAFGFKRH